MGRSATSHRRKLTHGIVYLSGLAVLAVVIGAWLGFSSYLQGDTVGGLADARIAYEAGDYARAGELLDLELSRRPDDPEVRRLYAWSLEAQARSDEALEQYRHAVEADPTDHDSLARMAIIERLLGRPTVAIAHFESAFAVQPGFEYADELARTYVQVGRFDEAAERWEWALSTDDLDDTVRAGMLAAIAEVRQAQRDFDGARAALREAVELRPDDERLRTRLELIGGEG